MIVRSCIGHLVQLQFRFDDVTLVSYLSCNFFQDFDVRISLEIACSDMESNFEICDTSIEKPIQFLLQIPILR